MSTYLINTTAEVPRIHVVSLQIREEDHLQTGKISSLAIHMSPKDEDSRHRQHSTSDQCRRPPPGHTARHLRGLTLLGLLDSWRRLVGEKGSTRDGRQRTSHNIRRGHHQGNAYATEGDNVSTVKERDDRVAAEAPL